MATCLWAHKFVGPKKSANGREIEQSDRESDTERAIERERERESEREREKGRERERERRDRVIYKIE